MEEIARRMVERFRAEIPAYGRLPAATLEGEIPTTARRNVELFFESLVEDRGLSDEELDPFRQSARNRAAEGLPLEDLLHAYRLGGRVGWEALVAAARPDEQASPLPAVSRLMEQVDRISDAVTQAYDDRSRDLLSAEERRAREMLDALTSDAPSEGEGVEYLPFAITFAGPADRQASRLRGAGVLAVTDGDEVVGVLEPEEREVVLSLDHDGAVYALGDPTPRAELGGALDDVRAAVELAARSGASGRIDVDRHLPDLLLAAAPRLAEQLRRRALGPLESYPGRRRADLLKTLDTFIECDFDRRRAAGRLQVHPNTLDYRLRRVEELTGLRIGTPSDLVLICLALRQRARSDQ